MGVSTIYRLPVIPDFILATITGTLYSIPGREYRASDISDLSSRILGLSRSYISTSELGIPGVWHPVASGTETKE